MNSIEKCVLVLCLVISMILCLVALVVGLYVEGHVCGDEDMFMSIVFALIFNQCLVYITLLWFMFVGDKR